MKKILSVSEVSKYIKTLLESNSLLKNLTVQGELSNVKSVSSGHLYFSLKDTQSKINCVMFKSAAEKLKFIPREGEKVTLRGGLGLYLPSGQYQMTVRSMEPMGTGDLFQAYFALKNELEAEGYFDKNHKKNLPENIERVGLVTSPTGAALRDMLAIIKRRNPLIDIVIYPSLVQGDEAAANLIEGIQVLNEAASVDVIIIGRGGGAIEDLWAFNDEALAKAIFKSKIPVVSAVGHETDFTIADFVADLRAPTPSGAAEWVADEIQNIQETLRMQNERLIRAMQAGVFKKRMALKMLTKTCWRFQPKAKIEAHRLTLDVLQERMLRGIKGQIKNKRVHLNQIQLRLDATNPMRPFQKGYVRVCDATGSRIVSVASLENGQTITLGFEDGKAQAKILSHSRSQKNEG